MRITEDHGVPYIKVIAEVLSEKIGHKVTCKITNHSINASSGVDHKQSGKSDIGIEFNSTLGEEYEDALLVFNISTMGPCGLAEVKGLFVSCRENVNKHCIDAINTIIDIFITDDGERIPFQHFMIYSDRYNLGKTLIFAGKGEGNELYEDLGFIKVAPYNNTRYEENTRFIYMLESRKRKTEPIKRYGSFPKYAIKKFSSRGSVRRKVDFSNAVIAKYKQTEKGSKSKIERPPWERPATYMGFNLDNR